MKIIYTLPFLFISFISNAQCENFNLSLTPMNPTCYNFCDGTVSTNVTGYNGMVNGEISDSAGNTSFLPGFQGTTPNILCAGWYFVEVEDDSGCYAIDSVQLFNPDQIQPQLSVTNPTTVSSCDGIAEVDTVLGFQGNYSNLSFFWNPGGPNGMGETIKTDLCYDNYSLTINDELGCSVVIEFSLGSASITSSNSENLRIYPNPVKDFIYFEKEDIKFDEMRIYRIDGQFVKTFNIEDNAVDISMLSEGQYVVELISVNKVYSSRIIKE